jgi:hypothetical protein
MVTSWLTRLTAPVGIISLCGVMIFALGCGSAWACASCDEPKQVSYSGCSSCSEHRVSSCDSGCHTSCNDCRIDTNVSLWAPDNSGGGSLGSTYFDESGREFAYENERDMSLAMFTDEPCTSCGSMVSTRVQVMPVNASYTAPEPRP